MHSKYRVTPSKFRTVNDRLWKLVYKFLIKEKPRVKKQKLRVGRMYSSRINNSLWTGIHSTKLLILILTYIRHSVLLLVTSYGQSMQFIIHTIIRENRHVQCKDAMEFQT